MPWTRRPKSIKRTVEFAVFVASALPAAVVVFLGIVWLGDGSIAFSTTVLLIALMVVMVLASWAFASVVANSVTADLVRLHAISAIVSRRHAEGVPFSLPPTSVQYVETTSILGTLSLLVARADEARKQNEEMAAFVAHDMRTPLAALAMSLSLMRSASDQERDWIAKQRGEVERLVRDLDLLVEALRGRSDGRFDDASSGQVTPSVVEIVKSVRHRVTYVDAVSVDVVVHRDFAVAAATDVVARIIENLMANAVRYGGGLLKVEVGNGFVRVTNDVKPITHRTQNGDALASHGLGHTIVKRRLDALGGKLVVQEGIGVYTVDAFFPVTTNREVGTSANRVG